MVGIGIFYLKLHALPERMSHRGQKVQMEIVAVLALIALFTHNHIFWIIGLLLAFIRDPGLLDADGLDRPVARRSCPAGTIPDLHNPLLDAPAERRRRRRRPLGRTGSGRPEPCSNCCSARC